jgi:hypothetical protein
LITARDCDQEHAALRRLAGQLLTIWEIEDTEATAHRSPYEEVANFLLWHFHDGHYNRGVELAREAVRDSRDYRVRWPRLAAIIRSRILRHGEPLRLLHHDANLPLDEDTDAEAYHWLDRMIRSVHRADQDIEVY